MWGMQSQSQSHCVTARQNLPQQSVQRLWLGLVTVVARMDVATIHIAAAKILCCCQLGSTDGPRISNCIFSSSVGADAYFHSTVGNCTSSREGPAGQLSDKSLYIQKGPAERASSGWRPSRKRCSRATSSR